MTIAAAIALFLATTAPVLAQAPAPDQPAPPAWIPRGTAELQALDKVDASSASLRVAVGETAHFGALSIQVRQCRVRPPDQPRDAAAYLVITDSHQGAPGFSGWMLAAEPQVSMLEHPVYDVRVTGCGAT